jgi:hypothetical protein
MYLYTFIKLGFDTSTYKKYMHAHVRVHIYNSNIIAIAAKFHSREFIDHESYKAKFKLIHKPIITS